MELGFPKQAMSELSMTAPTTGDLYRQKKALLWISTYDIAFPARSLFSMSVWVVNLIISIGSPCSMRVSCPDTKRTEFVR
jgi:hypothetical protein